MYSVVLMAALSTSPAVPDGILFNRGARASGCTGTDTAQYVEVTRYRRVRGSSPMSMSYGSSMDVYSNGCSGGMASGFGYAPMYFQPQGYVMQQSSGCTGGAGGQAQFQSFGAPGQVVFLSESPPPRRIRAWRDCGNGLMCPVF